MLSYRCLIINLKNAMKYFFSRLLTTSLLAVVASAVHAGPIPYPNTGVENPAAYSFTAASSGYIEGYFFSGAGASYTNELTMLINGNPTGIQGLNNHTSPYGTQLNLGAVAAGDQITFMMVNLLPGTIGPWYSDKSRNADGANHVYSTNFIGDSLIPAGVYVAFEDQDKRTGSDFNYNDLAFVFANINVSTVPEPGTLALLFLASLAGVAVGRRKQGAEKKLQDYA